MSTQIPRYNLSGYDSGMVAFSDGDWIRYADHLRDREALRNEWTANVKELNASRTKLLQQNEGLVKENEELRGANDRLKHGQELLTDNIKSLRAKLAEVEAAARAVYDEMAIIPASAFAEFSEETKDKLRSALAKSTPAPVDDELTRTKAKLAEVEADRDKLREQFRAAMLQYGMHRAGCNMLRMSTNQCGCGFENALRSALANERKGE